MRRLLTRCEHARTRCLHGDEVLQHMTRHTAPRQICLDCGRALDRGPLCLTAEHWGRHTTEEPRG